MRSLQTSSMQSAAIKAAVIMAAFLFASPLLADMLVRTTDGRVIRVDANKSDIRSIEFVDEATPPPPPPSARPTRPAPAPPSDSSSVAGVWSVTFSGNTTTTLTLHQDGNTVSGNLKTTDNSGVKVSGRINGDQLELSRDTGLQTIQHYKVIVKGNRFSGTFWNAGLHPDRGSFSGIRR